MSVKLKAFPIFANALAILLISCLKTPDCAAQGEDSQSQLAGEIRTAILNGTFSHKPQFVSINEATELTAQDCIRKYDSEAFQAALLVLLHDVEANVRETAAESALFYGLSTEASDSAIRRMLNDSDPGVNLAGLRMASDARLSPELVVRIALMTNHPFREEAIASLRSFLGVARQ